MPFAVISPRQDEVCYRYKIEVGRLHRTAYLTYEMPSTLADRSILLVDNPNDLVTTDQQMNEYDQLTAQMNAFAGGGRWRMGRAKSIVNRLVEGEWSLPNVSVAVHKFGPVPVYLLPDECDIILHDEKPRELKARIGIFPSRLAHFRSKNLTYVPPFINNNLEFVHSISIDLGLLFTRYLEDAAECMFDIEKHLGLSGVFGRAKAMEDIIGQSIGSKLERVIPSPEVLGKPVNEYDRLLRDVFRKDCDWIFTAAYARLYALFFLNELYRHIGVKSKESYLTKIDLLASEFDKRLGYGWAAEARERIDQVASLDKALGIYRKLIGLGPLHEDEVHEELAQVSSESLWTRRFVRFAEFLAYLHNSRVEPTRARVFISFHQDVPETVVLKRQMQSLAKDRFGEKVEFLFCEERTPGRRFKEIIKTRIWQSDTVSGIVPKNTRPVGRSEDKDYLWIAREAEHGLLLAKNLIFMVEKGTEEGKVREDLGREDMGFLAPDARAAQGRAARVAGSYDDRIRLYFNIAGMDDSKESLDPKVASAVLKEVERAIQRRSDAILAGFYSQFPDLTRKTLEHIQELVPYPKKETREWIIRKLLEKYPKVYTNEKVAAKAFASAWDLSKKRALEINGRSLHLMSIFDRRYYTGNLQRILKAFESSTDRHAVKEDASLKSASGSRD